MDAVGAYTADRAAALSGVPKSTIHWWARNDVLVPTVSATRVMLWSYADLMGLRVIYWLRQRKTTKLGFEVQATSMPAVRRALKQLRTLEMSLFEDGCPSVMVDGSGKIHVKLGESVHDLEGQTVSEQLLDLIAPFATTEGTRGPDLFRPREELRIVPGKLSGSPHVVHTRLETRALSALARDGYENAAIQRLYPYVSMPQIEQAIDLEKQLSANLGKRAA
jgi:uncharacterized protein (DUF433 family)/DNA-binding transcriptional MerR regulator